MQKNIEEALLGQLLVANTLDEQIDILMSVGTDDFEDRTVRQYLELISDYIFKNRQQIDIVTAYTLLKDKKFFDLKYFTSLTQGIYSFDEAFKYISLIRLRNEKKDVITLLKKTAESISQVNTREDLIDIKEKVIIELNKDKYESGLNFINYHEYINKLDENLTRDKDRGAEWGLIDLDTLTNGIEVPRLIILGGLKKSGKSRFIINTRYNLYQKDIPSVFISLEMPGYEITKLTISRFSGIPEPYLRSKTFISSEQKQIYEQTKNTINWDLLPTITPSGAVDVVKIVKQLRIISKLYKNAIVFIDYLQRISHDRNRQAFELENISNIIADATREHNITVILLSQLSNIAEREVPTIGHLKGSGGIGESADAILLLDNVYRRTKEKDKKNLIEIYIEQRYGDSGVVKATTDLSCCKFTDYAEHYITNDII